MQFLLALVYYTILLYTPPNYHVLFVRIIPKNHSLTVCFHFIFKHLPVEPQFKRFPDFPFRRFQLFAFRFLTKFPVQFQATSKKNLINCFELIALYFIYTLCYPAFDVFSTCILGNRALFLFLLYIRPSLIRM